MKKIITLGLIFLVFALAISGCSRQSLGEKAAEKIIEAQTGADVDINKDGNDVTIKTQDGESQYSTGGNAKIPDDFPKEFVVADDAKIMMSSSAEGAVTITYATDIEQGEMLKKYISSFSDLGWKKEMEVDLGTGKIASFSKDKERVSVTIGENSNNTALGKSIVSVTYAKE